MSETFTKIHNSVMPFDCSNGLTASQEVIYIRLLRFTIGFGNKLSCKVSYKQLSVMSGIKNISIQMKALKEKGWIDIANNVGDKNVITILPTPIHNYEKSYKIVKYNDREPIHSVNTSHSLSEHPPFTQLNGSRGAKESIKENFKEREFIIFKTAFKKHTPPKKWDEEEAYEIFLELSDENRGLLLDALPFQNNLWCKPDFNHKFTPKASNYLLKGYFLDEDIMAAVKDKKNRIQEKIKYKNCIQENTKNAATDEERKEALKPFLERNLNEEEK